MTITIKSIEAANREMDEIVESRHDRDDYDADLRDVWMRVANDLHTIQPPAHREKEADSLESDYVGSLESGELVVWGPEIAIPGASATYRHFQVIA